MYFLLIIHVFPGISLLNFRLYMLLCHFFLAIISERPYLSVFFVSIVIFKIWSTLWYDAFVFCLSTPGHLFWSLLGVACVYSVILLFVTQWTCSLPGSSVHGIFQARILEWVAISSSWAVPN